MGVYWNDQTTETAMKDYIVTLRFKFPAWDEKNGIPFEVQAKSKSDAVKKARLQAERDGHSGQSKSKGSSTFTATEARA